VSVEWLEALNQLTRSDEIQAVVSLLSAKLNLGASARIAVTNVGQVCRYVADAAGLSIRFLHEPEPADPAHSGIYDTRQDEMLIAELIAEMVIETFPVRAES